jgi:hypothetical protein
MARRLDCGTGGGDSRCVHFPRSLVGVLFAVAATVLPAAARAAPSFLPKITIISQREPRSVTFIVFEYEGYSYAPTNRAAVYTNPGMTVAIAAQATVARDGNNVVFTLAGATVYPPLADRDAFERGAKAEKAAVRDAQFKVEADELIQIDGQVFKASVAAKLFTVIPDREPPVAP